MSDASSAEFDGLMGAIRADSSDVSVMFGVLRRKLADALGSRVVCVDEKAHRRRSASQSVTVTLGEHEFSATLSDGALTTAVRLKVNGIALRTEVVGFDEWVAAVLEALRTEASRSDATRVALERLVSG